MNDSKVRMILRIESLGTVHQLCHKFHNYKLKNVLKLLEDQLNIAARNFVQLIE